MNASPLAKDLATPGRMFLGGTVLIVLIVAGGALSKFLPAHAPVVGEGDDQAAFSEDSSLTGAFETEAAALGGGVSGDAGSPADSEEELVAGENRPHGEAQEGGQGAAGKMPDLRARVREILQSFPTLPVMEAHREMLYIREITPPEGRPLLIAEVAAQLRTLPDAETRRYCCSFLGLLGEEAVGPLIEALLGDADGLVRARAAQALADIKSERALPALRAAAEDSSFGWPAVDASVKAIGWIGGPAATRHLMELWSLGVCPGSVCQAMGYLDPSPEVLHLLTELLNDEQMRSVALESLSRMAKDHPENTSLVEGVRMSLVSALGVGQPSLTTVAVLGLGGIGTPEDMPHLEALLGKLRADGVVSPDTGEFSRQAAESLEARVLRAIELINMRAAAGPFISSPAITRTRPVTAY